MELNRIGAQKFSLRKSNASVANLVHASFQVSDVLLQVDSLAGFRKRHLWVQLAT